MNVKISLVFVAALFAVLLQNCAPARYVKPLEKNQQAASFSFGGPIIGFAGTSIPIPFTTLSYARGINDRLTGFAGLHVTSLAFGNFQTDIGANYGVWKTERMGLSAAVAAQFATGLGKANSTRLWPSADINYYIQPKGKNSYAYGGVGSWFELSSMRAHGVEQKQHVLPNLHLGYQFNAAKFCHQVELKYLAPGINNLPGVVDYRGLSGKGAFGIYYGVTRKF